MERFKNIDLLQAKRVASKSVCTNCLKLTCHDSITDSADPDFCKTVTTYNVSVDVCVDLNTLPPQENGKVKVFINCSASASVTLKSSGFEHDIVLLPLQAVTILAVDGTWKALSYTVYDPGNQAIWTRTQASAATVTVNQSNPEFEPDENLLFGSSSINDNGNDAEDARMFFTKNPSFRAGRVEGTQWDDVNRGADSVAFGLNTTASGTASAVSGGDSNTASGEHASVAGGQNNSASGEHASVGGGQDNSASGEHASVGGGQDNDAAGQYARIGGGAFNSIDSTAILCTIAGGGSVIDNPSANRIMAGANGSTVGGGVGNDIGSIQCVIAGGNNNTIVGPAGAADGSAIGGGESHTMSGIGGTIAGGNSNSVSGLRATVGGGTTNSATASNATVAGGSNTTASGTGSFAACTSNTASGSHSVALGQNNMCSGTGSFAGGRNNTCSSTDATAFGQGHTVAGSQNFATGTANSTSGFQSVAMGIGHTANGHRTVALGTNCSAAANPGCFLFGDDDGSAGAATLTAAATGQFLARARGGTTFYSNAAMTLGVNLPAGGVAWAAVCDRNMKENLTEVDYQTVLDRVAQLPVYCYNYKGQQPEQRYVGPVAQEWHQLFPSSKDPLRIDTMDLDGVALAAVRGLLQRVQQLEAEVASLKHH